MAYPIWVTTAGNLGKIIENEYFQITLDAYNPGGGSLTYKFLAGALPPGIQVTSSGNIQGVPIVTNPENINLPYEFTVRVTNNTGKIADRTFSLTVHNITPPQIIPEVVYLGNYFDGSLVGTLDGQYFNLQLRAIEVNPEANLVWSLASGSLPPGLTLSSSGLISGIINPIPYEGDPGAAGYSNTTFNEYGYDFGAKYRNGTYTFTVRVFDGIYYDTFTYIMRVTAKGSWTADDAVDLVNDTYLTVDTDNRYVPIITTPPQSLPEIRSNSNFAFKIDAFDPNGDIVAFSNDVITESGFDSAPFDIAAFDQGGESLPVGLTLDPKTGWLYGTLGPQAEARKTYTFKVYAYKRDAITYISRPVQFTLTVLGDVNNTVTWVTPADLGEIDNGSISELFVEAHSTVGKDLVYSLVDLGSRLPQGLKLLKNGLISGRPTFEYFSIDAGATTIDKNKTEFDNTYTFTVLAKTTDGTASATQTFTVMVNNFNITPYENLYLKALPSLEQRQIFKSIVNNNDIFPERLLYRSGDEWFGRSNGIRSLFLAGLSPTQLELYATAMLENHFTKRIEFGNIKTARALDTNFNVKYEVVYIELEDLQTDQGRSPSNIDDLTGKINPWYDTEGNAYSVVYPNSFANMESALIGLDYGPLVQANPGALPGWMISPQENGKVLGFTRAVVLAYTKPDASKLIAYRLSTQGLQFNNVDFVVDRYNLDNVLSTNYNIDLDKFTPGKETTFDRISRIGTISGSVTYAIKGMAFDNINNKTVTEIRDMGGFDGVRAFNNGDTLVFAQQENFPYVTTPNDGWNDNGIPIPGYLENLLDPTVVNKRGGIWKINIDSLTQVVTLSFVSPQSINDRLQVNSGTSYSQSIIFYDGILKPGHSLPEYSLLDLLPPATLTKFDSNGTNFINNRDTYAGPSKGDKYLKFPKTGVFK
jgi:Putative Ig domain